MTKCDCALRDGNHASGCGIRYNDKIAVYGYVDIDAERYHWWGSPPWKFTKGNSPIQNISREEFMAALEKYSFTTE